MKEIFIHDGITYHGSLSSALNSYKAFKADLTAEYMKAGVLHNSEDFTFSDYLKSGHFKPVNV